MTDAPILICYDGSGDAGRAIDAAADLLGPRHAVVLDVGPPLTALESVAVMAPVTPGAVFEELNEDEARQRAKAGAQLAQRAGFDAEARAGLAAPTWEAIVDCADEIGAAVIVLGSRGLKGAREAFEGSVSHQVAKHAGRPVLIVPPPPHDDTSRRRDRNKNRARDARVVGGPQNGLLVPVKEKNGDFVYSDGMDFSHYSFDPDAWEFRYTTSA
jgi:nucleotide-binding universal stress UspA family protein